MLDPPVDVGRDHVLGPPEAELTLLEYGSYACPRCHAVHEVIEGLRNRFGERMRYVFRHLPVAGSEDAIRAAELAEYASRKVGKRNAKCIALVTALPRTPCRSEGQK